MSIGERYNEHVRRACFIMKKEFHGFSSKKTFQLSVKILSDSVEPEITSPTLAVSGTMPLLHLTRGRPSLPVDKQTIAIK